jgi:hypothetical protein
MRWVALAAVAVLVGQDAGTYELTLKYRNKT